MSQVVSNTPDEQGVQFTPEQQAKLNELLKAERLKGEAAVEAMRATAAAAIKSKLGITNADEFLAEQANQAAKDAAELAQLEAIFSDGMKSNALFLKDRTLWRTLKSKRDGLQGRKAPVVVPQGKAFRGNDT